MQMPKPTQIAVLLDELTDDELNDLALHLGIHRTTLWRWRTDPGKVDATPFVRLVKWLERRNGVRYDALKLLKPVTITAERA